MKFAAFRKYDYTADLWKFNATSDAEGGVIKEFYFSKRINLTITTDRSGSLLCVYPEQHTIGDQLRDIRDRNGREFMVNTIWQILGIVPVINGFGLFEEYRGRSGYVGLNG